MIDPRLSIIHRQLEPVRRILVFSSAKGGVGKSVCAAASALALSRMGFRSGLFDLDFQGASAHILLDVEPEFPEEAFGIKPLKIDGKIDFMSFAAFSREHPVPLRGSEVSQAMIELLAITVWNELDFLVVDMPPGMSDEILDLLRFMKGAEFIVISTPSQVVMRVVERLVAMLRSLEVPLLGIIENMANDADASPNLRLTREHRLEFLGSIPFLPRLARDTSDPRSFIEGELGRRMERILAGIT